MPGKKRTAAPQAKAANVDHNVNRRVLGYLDKRSAHSDVVEVLDKALEPLGDAQRFCPDWQRYRYVVASTRGIIFALACGMDTVGFRLDARMKPRALACGAEPFPECGSDWVSFTLFRNDWPQFDLGFWARQAYVIARDTSPRA